MNEKPKGDVGFVIGRFHVPELHVAHKELIQSVVDRHPKVVIILGLASLKTTKENPLDLEMRRHLLAEDFKNVQVAYVKDMREDDEWSKRLDEVVNDHLTPNQSAVLYGGRDSFIASYKGRFPTVELEGKRVVSGSEIRAAITKKVMATKEFRCGVIWATGNQWPTVFTTVDIAIINRTKREVLLAKKPNEKLYRFVGGFASPNSESFESDAIRETIEETGLEIDNLIYLGSFKIDDWRYDREINKIKTLFFAADYLFGAATPNDDISEVRWMSYNEISGCDVSHLIVDEHKPLMKRLIEHLTTKEMK